MTRKNIVTLGYLVLIITTITACGRAGIQKTQEKNNKTNPSQDNSQEYGSTSGGGSSGSSGNSNSSSSSSTGGGSSSSSSSSTSTSGSNSGSSTGSTSSGSTKLTSDDEVKRIYKHCLNRNPKNESDSDELASGVKTATSTLINNVCLGSEAKSYVLYYFRHYLGRDGADSERQSWLNQNYSIGITAIEHGIANSQEASNYREKPIVLYQLHTVRPYTIGYTFAYAAPAGWLMDGPVFYVYTTPAVNRVPFYNCYRTNKLGATDFFWSNAYNCEGFTKNGDYYLLTTTGGSAALGRFHNIVHDVHAYGLGGNANTLSTVEAYSHGWRFEGWVN